MLRRAMGKKKKSELDKQYAGFDGRHEGAAATPTAAVKTLWDILLPFSDYAFNKAHSAAYGLVSYWTAYLKANYPAEYMAALLTSVKDDKDKMAIYLAECRRMGIKVLPPCVNSSEANFTPTGTDIRFGLTAIRNVGANVVASVVATRKAKGAFADFADFLRKVDAVVCNKRTIEALIKGGAFDSLGHTRRGLINVYEPAVDAVLDTKRAEAIGQFDLFGSWATTTPARRPTTCSPSGCPRASGTRRCCCSSSARCSGSTSPTTRCSGSSTSSPSAADATIATVQADGRATSRRRSRWPASCPRSTGGSPRPARRGPTRCSRTSRARSRCCSSRRPTRRWR